MLRISFINVGYGDAILIEELMDSRRVFSMLVDGGVPYVDSYRASYDLRPSRIPAFRYLAGKGIDALDAVFLTHFHIDHVGGLPEVAENRAIRQLWLNFSLTEHERLASLNARELSAGSASEQATANEMRLSLNLLAETERIARARGARVERLGGARRVVALSDDLNAEFFEADPALSARTERLVAEILSPDTETVRVQRALAQLDSIQNAAGVALRLSYRGRRVLLPADVPAIRWSSGAWGTEELRADVVKLAHHGQADSMTKELVAKIQPRHAVISVSEDNPFGAPSPAVFDMFDPGVEFWTTESIEVPPRAPGLTPRLARGPARQALIFEIHSDGDIRASLDRA